MRKMSRRAAAGLAAAVITISTYGCFSFWGISADASEVSSDASSGGSGSGNFVANRNAVGTSSAGAAASDAGIWFDWNQDGVTDDADYRETETWLKSYSMELSVDPAAGDMYVQNGNNEAADSIKTLILQQTGAPAALIDYGINVKNVRRFCINNVGLGTPVGNQTPYGTCWAFAENSAVESAILRARTGYNGETILKAGSGMEKKTAGSPILTGLDQNALMSPLYLATEAFSLQKSGTQRGEGLALRADNKSSIYNAGGFLTTAQMVYSNWDGPVTESDEPYSALVGSLGSPSVYKGTGSALLRQKDQTAAHLQDYYIYSSPAITEEDADNQLRIWRRYSQAATNTMKQALVKYGALAIMNGTDEEMPSDEGLTSSFNYNTWMQYSSERNVTHNHAVTIVGWDDTIPASTFSPDRSKQPEGDGAWLVKNSWGSYEGSVQQYGRAWIEDYFSRVTPGTKGYYLAQQGYNYGIPDENGHGTGYFWLSYYDHSIAAVAAAAEVDIPDDGYDYDHNYTYQYAISLANTALVLPTDNTQTKVCNVYSAQGNESLNAVSVEAPTTGITTEIQVYTYDAGTSAGVSGANWNPEKGQLVASKSVTLAEMGLHTVKLDQPVSLKKGQKFAVVEKIYSAVDSSKSNIITWLNLETAIAEELQTPENYSDEVTKVVANAGETWAYVQQKDGSYAWVQPKDLNRSAAGRVFQFGNALIHAYTSDR